MRKGQAALEFLTTYGWAFLVILVMIGALAYFGVLNPAKALPPKCVVEAGWSCRDYVIHEDSVSINLINNKGDTLNYVYLKTIASDTNQTAFAISSCTIAGVAAYPGSAANASIASEASMPIVCNINNLFQNMVGQKAKVTYSVNYRTATGSYDQTFQGEIQTTIQA